MFPPPYDTPRTHKLSPARPQIKAYLARQQVQRYMPVLSLYANYNIRFWVKPERPGRVACATAKLCGLCGLNHLILELLNRAGAEADRLGDFKDTVETL